MAVAETWPTVVVAVGRGCRRTVADRGRGRGSWPSPHRGRPRAVAVDCAIIHSSGTRMYLWRKDTNTSYTLLVLNIWDIVLSRMTCFEGLVSSRRYRPDQELEIYNFRMVPELQISEKLDLLIIYIISFAFCFCFVMILYILS